MMHVSKKKILEMANKDSVLGLYVEKSTPTPCSSCLVGKSTCQPFPKNLDSGNLKIKTEVLELVTS